MVLLNVAQMQIEMLMQKLGLCHAAAFMATPVNMFSLNAQIPILELAV